MQFVDPVKVTMRVNQGMYSGVTTCDLSALAAETCAYLGYRSPWPLDPGGQNLRF